MRINHLTKIRWVDFLKSNVVLVLHYFLFLAAFVFGALSVMLDYNWFDSTHIGEVFNNGLITDYWNLFKYCFLVCFAIITAVYFFSFYPFGAPITIIIFTLYSFVVGFISASVCRDYGFRGLAFNTVSLVVPTIIFAIVFALLSSASVSFSVNVANIIFKNKAAIDIKQKTKDVFILYLILTVIVVLNSLLTSFLIMIISRIITT